MKNKILRIGIVFLPLAILLVLWEFRIAYSQHGQFLYSSPSLIISRLIKDVISGTLASDIYITAGEAITGFILGSIIGSVAGLSLWLSHKVASWFRIYVVILGSVPIFAIAPMTVLWFGTGFFAKVMMAFLTTVFITLSQAYDGARNIQHSQLQLMKSIHASRWQVFITAIIPASIAWVLASYRINVGLAILGAFLGEIISAEKGLGHYIMKGSALYDSAQVLAGILSLIAVAGCLYLFVWLIEKLLFPWHLTVNKN